MKYKVRRIEYGDGRVIFKVIVKGWLFWSEANSYGFAAFDSATDLSAAYSPEYSTYEDALEAIKSFRMNQIVDVRDIIPSR